MPELKTVFRLISIVLVCALFFGCKTIPQTSGGGSSSGSSGSSSSGSSSGSAGSSASLPGGGGYNPFPSSGSRSGNKGKKGAERSSNKQGDSGTGSEPESGGVERSSKERSGESGSEDRTLSEALEEFERARKSGQDAGAAQEETDFPIELEPENDVAGDAIEQMEGVEGATGEDSGGAQTGAEKVAVLDRQLEESYGQFEGVILREREYVRGKENTRGSDADIDAEIEQEGPGADKGDSDPRGEITGSGAGSRPDGGDQRDGEFEHAAAAHAPPPDIPDGTDDDVVARQLREAAMQEPDPELREKLWDEYRKYKNEGKGL